jgi:hypothetical protein
LLVGWKLQQPTDRTDALRGLSQIAVVQKLVQIGCDINHTDTQGNTPLVCHLL